MKKTNHPTLSVSITFNRELTDEELKQIHLSSFTVTVKNKTKYFKCVSRPKAQNPHRKDIVLFYSTKKLKHIPKSKKKQKLKESEIPNIDSIEIQINEILRLADDLAPRQINHFIISTTATTIPADIMFDITSDDNKIQQLRSPNGYTIKNQKFETTYNLSTTNNSIKVTHMAKPQVLNNSSFLLT